MKLIINKEILSDVINLYTGVFEPLNKFSSEKDVIKISENFITEKKDYFPLPILFPISKQNKKKIYDSKNIKLYYKNIFISEIKIINIFRIKKKYVKKIFGFYDTKHPGINNFFNINKFYIDCEIKKFDKKILKKVQFDNPNKIKKKLYNISCAGFHTRNVPHRAHMWIHRFGQSKCKKVLIQPMIGQFKKGEFKEKFIIKSNFVISKYDKKNLIFSKFFSYPRYCGPREAIFHSIVRKNYGCSHFLVGRDHAGYKNYFKKYASQKLCKINEKKIGIKFLTFKEPFICKTCKSTINKKCKKCKKINKIHISGTKIRSLIKRNKKVPEYFMDNKIYNIVKKNSLIN